MIQAKLVVVGGEAKAKEVELRLPTMIGRGKEADLSVPHALVSRRHTELFERDGYLYARDLGSLNGTYVGNQRIQGEQVLKPDQLLTLGTITFRAKYEPQPVSPGDASSAPTLKEVTVDDQTPAKESGVSEILTFDETVPLESPDADTRESMKFKPPQSQEDEVRSTPVQPAPSSFALDVDEAPQQDCSESALAQLPQSPAAISSIGALDLEEASAASVEEEQIRIDLGEDQPAQPLEDDSRMGSFLNKLPR